MGWLLVADVGATRARVAVCDLLGTIPTEDEELLDVAAGPDTLLDELDRRWGRLREDIDRPVPPLRGVGVSLPGDDTRRAVAKLPAGVRTIDPLASATALERVGLVVAQGVVARDDL